MINIFALLLYFCICVSCAPVITGVFDSGNYRWQYQVQSSLLGGRQIQISVEGHSMIPTRNKIWVGTFPCEIPPNAVTRTKIFCVTTDSGSEKDINNLPVTLISPSGSFTTTYPNVVHYTNSATPQIIAVYPASSTGNQVIHWLGRNLDNIQADEFDKGSFQFTIGQQDCVRNYNQWLYYYLNNQQVFSCKAPSSLQSGKYQIKKKVKFGIARKAPGLTQLSWDSKQPYQLVILPNVNSVTPQSGAVGGQIIRILGSGFSTNRTKNKVEVDGTLCTVISSTRHHIQCRLSNRNQSASQLNRNNSASIAPPYKLGAGLYYKLIRWKNSFDNQKIKSFYNATQEQYFSLWKADQRVHLLENESIQFTREDKLNTELRSIDYYQKVYNFPQRCFGQSWKGYFTPPSSGNYTFRGISSGIFYFYLQDTYEQLPSKTPLIYHQGTTNNSNFYQKAYLTAEKTIQLKSQHNYYIVAQHFCSHNYITENYFQMTVDIPNEDKTLENQVYQVDKIIIKNQYQPKIIEFFFSEGFIGGNMTLIMGQQKVTISYGCSGQQFLSALFTFKTIKNYQNITFLNSFNMLDSDNVITNDPVHASFFSYEIAVYNNTSDLQQISLLLSSEFNGTVQNRTVQTFNNSISGNWKLAINGQPLYFQISIKKDENIPYNVSDYVLQQEIRRIKGLQKISVQFYYYNNTKQESYVWIVKFVGYLREFQKFQLDGSNLKSSKNVMIEQFRVRNYSSSITVPIDYRFLSVRSSSPSILIEVNGIPSVCSSAANCGYKFIEMPSISDITFNYPNLTASLSRKISLPFHINELKVTVQGYVCSIIQVLNYSFVCALQENNSIFTYLVAGQLQAEFQHPKYGFLAINSSVVVPKIPLQALFCSIQSENIAYIKGRGFPSLGEQANITICNKRATILNISNQFIRFILPICFNKGIQTISLTVNGQFNSSLTIDYANISAIIIERIKPQSANPTVKGILQIYGSGFGEKKEVAKAYLMKQGIKAYELKILYINDTYIKAGRPGGLAGNYTIMISLPESKGDSTPLTTSSNLFSYFVSVSSILPSFGSYQGGTLITIQGQNFDPVSPNTAVFIGDTLNWFCQIQEITETRIKCRTPPISEQYQPEKPVQVVVTSKLITLNECVKQCSFTYAKKENSPQLEYISTGSIVTGNITLKGRNLNSSSNGKCQVYLLDSSNMISTQISSQNCSSEQALFEVSADIQAGQYMVRIRNDLGQSNALNLTILWSPGTISSVAGSLAGSFVSFSEGSGYPKALKKPFSILLSSDSQQYSVQIASCCQNNTLALKIPEVDIDTIFTITFNLQTKQPQHFVLMYSSKASLTPSAQLFSSNNVTQDRNTVQINLSNFGNITLLKISFLSLLNSTFFMNVQEWILNGTLLSFQTKQLFSGSYKISILSSGGYIDCKDIFNVELPLNYQVVRQSISYAGGLFTVSGSNLSPASYLIINGAKKVSSFQSKQSISFEVPAYLTADTQISYKLGKTAKIQMEKFTIINDMNDKVVGQRSFDNSVYSYYQSANKQCWIGIDAGSAYEIELNSIRFYPNGQWTYPSNYIRDSFFEGSKNLIEWETLAVVDSTIHKDYNTIIISSSVNYRFFRFRHNQLSGCKIAEIQIYGLTYSTDKLNLVSDSMPITFYDGYNNITYQSVLQFRQDATPLVESVQPKYGDVFGGYNITITGKNFGFANPTIKIDGIQCQPQTYNSSTIICLVGARLQLPSPQNANSFILLIGGQTGIIRSKFIYVLRWSDERTWGVDLPPMKGDIVYVPKGLTLLVDESTPLLEAIVVQNGTLLFENNTKITVQAGFITLVGGQFIAGTQDSPFYGELSIILYGSYYDKQLPMFGNKGIGCLECKFSIYGIPRYPVWTDLSSTIQPGSSIIEVSQVVDWKIGEEIVIASTSFLHSQAEKRKIIAVNGSIITVDSPLLYQHLSVQQQYGTKTIYIKAEVGLLTRNIKIMGDNSSSDKNYGSHLMLVGQSVNGFEAKIAFTEFTLCGQPQNIGRYCVYFNNNGEIPSSFVRGISVHDSYARMVALFKVHLLKIENNVGYRIQGHNFFLESGTQTKNTFKSNLVISSLSSSNMLQTDQSVASFFISHPSNDLIQNHAAGSEFAGIWFKSIKNYYDQNYDSNCVFKNLLGRVDKNVIHSNANVGLRIQYLNSLKYPCQSYVNNQDPTISWLKRNPSIPSVFSNLLIYRNVISGINARYTGNIVISLSTIAEFYCGIYFQYTQISKEPALITNSILVGKLKNNQKSLSSYQDYQGISTPSYGSLNITDTLFYQFSVGSQVLRFVDSKYADQVYDYDQSGNNFFVRNLQFNQIYGNYSYLANNIIVYDLDGSLSLYFDGRFRTSATLVIHLPHLVQNKLCVPSSNSQWRNTLLCDEKAKIRKIIFKNYAPSSLSSQYNQIKQIATQVESVQTFKNNTQFISRFYGYYAIPFITGQTYGLWWGNGTDFDSLNILPSNLFSDQDDAVILKFYYTAKREIFQVKPLLGCYNNVLQNQGLINKSSTLLDAKTCNFSQYYHHNFDMTICVSGKNKLPFLKTQVKAIFCRHECFSNTTTNTTNNTNTTNTTNSTNSTNSTSNETNTTNTTSNQTNITNDTTISGRQSFIRLWSNVTQWPNQTLPTEGDQVYIPYEWTIQLDIDPTTANLTIDGALVVNDTKDITLTSKAIFIRPTGSINVGTANQPFSHTFIVKLVGQKGSKSYGLDQFVYGNKILGVNGQLNLFGDRPRSLNTFLTSTARKGQTYIQVAEHNDWKADDQLALSPSFSKTTEFERVVIQSIGLNNIINLKAALKYTHFGAENITINNTFGQIDARTKVGHLTRSIKIVSGENLNWGYRIVVYNSTNSVYGYGSITLDGVELVNGGQHNTQKGALSFIDINQGLQTSQITNSSFSNCKTYCLSVQNSNTIFIEDNVFYDSKINGVQVKNSQRYTFNNNLMIGVSPRTSSSTEMVSCFSTYSEINILSDQIYIRNNYCIGSAGYGFALPHVQCSQLENHTMMHNTAGSSKIGFVFNRISSSCQAFSYLRAYACQIGQISGAPYTNTLIYSNFMLADNQRGATLKFGSSQRVYNNSAFFKNSYITAVSRPSCLQCYGSDAIICSSMVGVRMLSVSVNGNNLPANSRTQFDSITKQEVFDHNAYLFNIVFDSFRQTYTSGLGVCKSNFAFRPHSEAYDSTAVHNLQECSCTNCDLNSYAYCEANNPNQIGWYGGCGSIACTGKSNYLIQDLTGTFLTKKGVIIPHNRDIGDNQENCTFSTQMNGFVCFRQDFGILSFQSIAPDFKTRIMWPVTVTGQGLPYSTTINGFREWEWNLNSPENNRFGRFIAVIRNQISYNINFVSQPPINMQFQLQKRTISGNNKNFVTLNIRYNLPNSIRAQVNGIKMKPIALINGNLSRPLNTSLCGDNIFFYDNSSISFVVTEDSGCLVKIFLTDSIRLTTHFAMNISEFFSNSVATSFINNLCALLKIKDTSRVKIVGIYAGSIAITTFIESEKVAEAVIDENGTVITNTTDANSSEYSNTTDNASTTVSMADTSARLISAIQDGSFAADMQAALGSTVLSAESTFSVVPTFSETNSFSSGELKQLSVGAIIGATIGAIVFICIIIFGGIKLSVYCRKQSNKIQNMNASKAQLKQKEQKENEYQKNNNQDQMDDNIESEKKSESIIMVFNQDDVEEVTRQIGN